MLKLPHRVTCKSAFAGAILGTILTSEGHSAFWYLDGERYTIITDAPHPALMACIESANSAIPRSQR